MGRRDESDTGSTREEIRKYLSDNSWRLEVEEFTEAILKDKEIIYGNSFDALLSMKMIYRIYWNDPEWRAAFDIECPDE